MTLTTTAAASLSRSRHNKHWPATLSTQMHCRLCSSRGQKKGTQCARCDMGLCMVPCFVEYHTNINLLYIILFVNTVCCDKIVIQGATDLMQQPQLYEQ